MALLDFLNKKKQQEGPDPTLVLPQNLYKQ